MSKKPPIFSRINVLSDAGPSEDLVHILAEEVIWGSDLLLRQSRRRDIYDRMRWRNDAIASAYEALIEPIKGAPLKVVPAVDDHSPEGQQQAQRLTDLVQSSRGMRQIMDGLLEIPWRGYGGVELTGTMGLGEPLAGEHRIPGAVEVPPESLIFDVLGNPRLRIRGEDETVGIDLCAPDLRWRFIVAHWGSTKGGNWFGTGIAQRVYWLYWFHTTNTKNWNKALEKFAMPTLLANVTGKDYDTIRKRILTMFRDYVADSGLVVPADQAEVEQLGSANAFPGYEKMDETMRKAIRIAILGASLTQDQGSVGSQALGTVHAEQLTDRQQSIVRWMQDVLTDTLITYLSEAEFGAYYGHRLEVAFEEVEDQNLVLQQVQAASDLGLMVNRDELYQKLDFEAPDPEATEVEVIDLTKPTGLPPIPGQQFMPQPLEFPMAEGFAESGGLVDAKRENARLSDLDGLSVGSAVTAARQTVEALADSLGSRIADEAKKKTASRESKPVTSSAPSTSEKRSKPS